VAEGLVELKTRDSAAVNIPLVTAVDDVVSRVREALARSMMAADEVR
jgi:IMP dehydrogenase/GMP reductase